ncbi:ComF family protein [Candidatus Uhrbacteria bacterium]|nr:ComF family protein [Candidatus Uhrbacteria bacterium]
MEGRFSGLARGGNALIGRLACLVGQALFPHFCLKCGQEGLLVCPECVSGEDARLRGVFWCPACGVNNGTGQPCPGCRDRTEFSAVVSAETYGRSLPQRLLQVWKYQGVSEAGEILCGLFRDFLAGHPETAGFLRDHVVVPVPLHPFRLAERGFNQAETIARTLSVACGLPVRTDILQRRWQWHKQATVSDPAKRQANAAGSVAVNPAVGVPERVVLVDDVMTTGATLSLCARCLKSAGCREVKAVTVLRG